MQALTVRGCGGRDSRPETSSSGGNTPPQAATGTSPLYQGYGCCQDATETTCRLARSASSNTKQKEMFSRIVLMLLETTNKQNITLFSPSHYLSTHPFFGVVTTLIKTIKWRGVILLGRWLIRAAEERGSSLLWLICGCSDSFNVSRWG